MNKNILAAEISKTMEEWISDGKWALNTQIPTEVQLMSIFEVSRNTLREAIHGLAQAGLLEIKQGRGTYVRAKNRLETALLEVSKQSSFDDIISVRLALETLAAKLAAKNRTKEDIENMVVAFNQATESNDSEGLTTADTAFHLSIVKASKNPLLIELYENIIVIISQHISQQFQTYSSKFSDEHQVLLKAIIQKDEKMATDAVINMIHNID